jgi:hypothetical protein
MVLTGPSFVNRKFLLTRAFNSNTVAGIVVLPIYH